MERLNRSRVLEMAVSAVERKDTEDALDVLKLLVQADKEEREPKLEDGRSYVERMHKLYSRR